MSNNGNDTCFPVGSYWPGIAHLMDGKGVEGLVPWLDSECEWVRQRIALVDLETGGTDPTTDYIVEIGVVIGENGEIVDEKNWLVKPSKPLRDEVIKIHGITNEMVENCPSFADVAEEFLEFIQGCIPAAYNNFFDKSFILSALSRAGLGGRLDKDITWLDPFIIGSETDKFEKGKKLADFCRRYDIPLDGAHRAVFDSRASLMLLYKLAKNPKVPAKYSSLVLEQKRWRTAQDEMRSKWRNKK